MAVDKKIMEEALEKARLEELKRIDSAEDLEKEDKEFRKKAEELKKMLSDKVG